MKRSFRWLILSSIVAGAFAAFGGTAAEAAPYTQGPPLVCDWNRLPPQSAQGSYFSAAAYDTNQNMAYFYGGISQIGEVVNTVSALDVSNLDPDKAAFSTPILDGSRAQRYGAAGTYRPNGDRSAAYFLGGSDPDGDGTTEVHVLNTKDQTWRKQIPTSGKKRLFHAAAYLPSHDVIVVAGGTKRCPLDPEAREAGDCEADNLGTQFLHFNNQTGDMHWENGPNGGPQNLQGISLVYDSRLRRVLAFGGTRDNNLGENRVFVLDVSDPDLSKAEWKTLAVDGIPPKARFYHSAVYDANANRMIVHGGVTQNGLGDGENVIDDTWALELGGAKPAWVNLGVGFRDLAGASMLYSSNHRKALIHGGRAKFKTGNSQTTFRDAHLFSCALAPTPTPGPTRAPIDPGTPSICDYLLIRVPAAVINNAIANPQNIRGWGELANPSLPPGPTNPYRTQLGLQNAGVPYHPIFNSVAFMSGCQ